MLEVIVPLPPGLAQIVLPVKAKAVGLVFTVTALDTLVPAQLLALGAQVIFPDVAPQVTVIEAVPEPPVMLVPLGTDQLQVSAAGEPPLYV